MSRSFPRLGLCLALFFVLNNSKAQAQTVLFSDNFGTPTLNTSLWDLATDGAVNHRTRFGNQPTMLKESSTTFMRMPLSTYAPADAIYDPKKTDAFTHYFFGTDIASKKAFSLGQGVEFEARIRGNNLPPGTVMAFFTYNRQGVWPDTLKTDEIDYEILGNMPVNQMWNHIWNDWNPNYGYDKGIHDLTTTPIAEGWNRNKWTTYKIRWLNDRIECYVNKVLVRTETAILPDDPMKVEMNIWVPDSSWTAAYDASMQTTSQSESKTYSMDVDYVQVRTIKPPATAKTGNGTGLTATYFDNPDLTGTKVSRIEPRINFNWSTYFPETALQQDTFSARWTGQVQAQYTEPYTFTTKTDDGVRLWINGKLVLEHWQNQTGNEWQATVNLVAGAKYNIKMEYFQDTGDAMAQLYWSSPSTPRQLVPQAQLYPTYVEDTIAPQITMSSPGQGFSYTSPPPVSGKAGDKGGTGLDTVNYLLFRNTDSTYWNGTTWTATLAENPAQGTSLWTVTLPSLNEGGYQIQGVARDNTGNTTYTPWRPFFVDNTAPLVDVTAPAAGKNYNSLTQAYGTATDTLGVKQIYLALYRSSDYSYWNGTAWVTTYTTFTAKGTTKWTYPMPTLTPGEYSLQAISQDFVGNTRNTGWIPFTINSKTTAIANATPSAPTS